jgi:hypothetical protein
MSANYEAPHFAVFFSHFISRKSKNSTQTPSAFGLPLMSEVRFCTHAEPQANCIFSILILFQKELHNGIKNVTVWRV